MKCKTALSSAKKISLTKHNVKDCLSCLFSFHFCHSFPVEQMCVLNSQMVASTERYICQEIRSFHAKTLRSHANEPEWDDCSMWELPPVPLISDTVCFTVTTFVRKQTSSDFTLAASISTSVLKSVRSRMDLKCGGTEMAITLFWCWSQSSAWVSWYTGQKHIFVLFNFLLFSINWLTCLLQTVIIITYYIKEDRVLFANLFFPKPLKTKPHTCPLSTSGWTGDWWNAPAF